MNSDLSSPGGSYPRARERGCLYKLNGLFAWSHAHHDQVQMFTFTNSFYLSLFVSLSHWNENYCQHEKEGHVQVFHRKSMLDLFVFIRHVVEANVKLINNDSEVKVGKIGTRLSQRR